MTLNLLDTPGYPDFVGELRAGLRAADAAVFVVSGADDIDRPVSLLWRECSAVGMPRAVVVTHLDQPRADFAATVDTCRRTFGDARATHWPVARRRTAVTGVVGLLTGSMTTSARTSTRTPATPSSSRSSRSRRTPPCSTATSRASSSTPTALLARPPHGDRPQGTFFPILPVSPLTGAGVEELLGIIERAFPDPTVHPLPAVTTPVGGAINGRDLRPRRSRSWPRSSGRRPTPTSGASRSCGSSRARLRVDETVHVSGHLGDFVGHEVAGHPCP